MAFEAADEERPLLLCESDPPERRIAHHHVSRWQSLRYRKPEGVLPAQIPLGRLSEAVGRRSTLDREAVSDPSRNWEEKRAAPTSRVTEAHGPVEPRACRSKVIQ